MLTKFSKSKRLRLTKFFLNILTNATYLTLIFLFLNIQQIIQIIVISKFHLKFLDNPKRNKLVKTLISYEYGNIWTIYDINLPYKNLTNLTFIHKLFNEFEFIMKLSNSNIIPNTHLKLTRTLAILGKQNCISYWKHKLKLKDQTQIVFPYITQNHEWPLKELIKQLQNIQITTSEQFRQIIINIFK